MQYKTEMPNVARESVTPHDARDTDLVLHSYKNLLHSLLHLNSWMAACTYLESKKSVNFSFINSLKCARENKIIYKMKYRTKGTCNVSLFYAMTTLSRIRVDKTGRDHPWGIHILLCITGPQSTNTLIHFVFSWIGLQQFTCTYSVIIMLFEMQNHQYTYNYKLNNITLFLNVFKTSGTPIKVTALRNFAKHVILCPF